MAKTNRKKNKKKEADALEKDTAESYNQYKLFEGMQYSGMKIGRLISGTMMKASGKTKKLLLINGKLITM